MAEAAGAGLAGDSPAAGVAEALGWGEGVGTEQALSAATAAAASAGHPRSGMEPATIMSVIRRERRTTFSTPMRPWASARSMAP